MEEILNPPIIRSVVPYRSLPDRERLRQWVTEYLSSRTNSVHFSDHKGEVFNRSAAINNAVRLANPDPTDVLAIADADCFITSKRFAEGAKIAHETGRLVIPHDSVCRTTEPQCEYILDHLCPIKGPTGSLYRKHRSRQCVSGLVFLRFDSFLLINGFDESFVGWGGEDNAFKIAAQTLLGRVTRLKGPLFHLWHARQGGRNNASAQYRANRRRWLSYYKAKQIYVYYKTIESGFSSRSTYDLERELSNED